MPVSPSVYRLIRHAAEPVVDRALAEALPSADPSDRRLILLCLLERGNREALVAVVRHYHLLGQELQSIVPDHAAVLEAAARAAAEGADPQTWLNIVELVVHARGYRLAYLLSGALQTRHPAVTERAAAGLLALVRLAIGPQRERAAQPPRASALTLKWLDSAIDKACAAFHQHRRHDVVLAVAALAPRRLPGVMRCISGRHAAAHLALRGLVLEAGSAGGAPGGGTAARAMLFFAGFEPLRTAVIRALGRGAMRRHLEELLEPWHLLAVPAVRVTLRRLRDGGHLLPTARSLRTMAPALRRRLPRWIEAVGPGEGEAAAALRPFIDEEDRLSRLLALRALMSMDDERAMRLVEAMCLDPEPAVARIALRHLMARRWGGLTELMVRMTGSPHEPIRRMAERYLAPRGFARLWRNWDKLEAPMQTAAGRALSKIDPRFDGQLLRRLAGGAPRERLRAVGMVRRLGLAGRFERRLVELADDADPRVASSAARALGSIRSSSRVEGVLHRLLHHGNDRVRANAIESIEEMGRVEQARDVLMELAAGRGNRGRANALKALSQLPDAEAAPGLRRMLLDGDPRHRISALWVVERTGLISMAHHVAAMAQRDPDARVRRRALRILSGLLSREGASGGAWPVGSGAMARPPRAGRSLPSVSAPGVPGAPGAGE